MSKSSGWAALVGAAFAVFTWLAPPEWIGSHARQTLAGVASIVLLIGLLGWVVSRQHEQAFPDDSVSISGSVHHLRTSHRLVSFRDDRTAKSFKTEVKSNAINETALDAIAVDRRLTISEIRYGGGPQAERVGGERLWALASERLLETCREWVSFDNGDRYVLKNLFSGDEKDRLLSEASLHYPRELTVVAAGAQPDRILTLYRICDIPYLEASVVCASDEVHLPCTNGRGGLSDFLDASARYQTTNPYIVGDETNGVGAVSILVLVEHDEAGPVCRSQYVVIVRKGILYSDDIWMSKVSGQPFLAPGPGEPSRLLK